ncbi:hypothetical protein CEXT_203861 [Caerostris extrusa]|uniref:Uncharacterized protein n=1 Tax=Caerostris extrusa TaxID=172846 RepID=A0AAV4Y2Y5_CAEEX|nr:hypothetical protein CEXT_203861 [Caerostris extrusa]
MSVQPTRGPNFLPGCQIAENVFISKSISISYPSVHPFNNSSSLAHNPFEGNQYLLPRHFSLPRNSHMARENKFEGESKKCPKVAIEKAGTSGTLNRRVQSKLPGRQWQTLLRFQLAILLWVNGKIDLRNSGLRKIAETFLK